MVICRRIERDLPFIPVLTIIKVLNPAMLRRMALVVPLDRLTNITLRRGCHQIGNIIRRCRLIKHERHIATLRHTLTGEDRLVQHVLPPRRIELCRGPARETEHHLIILRPDRLPIGEPS